MDDDETTTVAKLKQYAQKFVEEREDWRKRHNMKNIAAALMVESAEFFEPFTFLSEKESEEYMNSPDNRKKVAGEAADVLFHILEFAEKHKIDLTNAFYNKMEKTEEKYPPDKVVHEMRLDDGPFRKINAGEKLIEVRVYDEKRKKIKAGHNILLSRRPDLLQKMEVEVLDTHIYDTIESLVEAEADYFPRKEDKKDAVNSFYDRYKEKAYTHHAVAIIIRKSSAVYQDLEQD